MARQIVAGVLGVLLAVAFATVALGELVPGAVLYTRDNAGDWVGTRLWVLDHEGATWVRVARPSSAWFRRLRVDPRVELARDGVRTGFRAHPHWEPATRAAIDAVFRAQNGTLDVWYGWLLRRDAIPIELVLAPEGVGP